MFAPRHFIFVILISLLYPFPIHASEIFGNISTNPNNVSDVKQSAPVTGDTAPSPSSGGGVVTAPPAPGVGGDDSLLTPQQVNELSDATPPPSQLTSPTAAVPLSNTPRVLSIKLYPDGTLLRGLDYKIYVVQGSFKKYIANLAELQNYRGRKIITVTDNWLSYYQTREHGEGELIRQWDDVKIYVIVKGEKHHILNLAELRAHYAGLEIFNISLKEMALY